MSDELVLPEVQKLLRQKGGLTQFRSKLYELDGEVCRKFTGILNQLVLNYKALLGQDEAVLLLSGREYVKSIINKIILQVLQASDSNRNFEELCAEQLCWVRELSDRKLSISVGDVQEIVIPAFGPCVELCELLTEEGMLAPQSPDSQNGINFNVVNMLEILEKCKALATSLKRKDEVHPADMIELYRVQKRRRDVKEGLISECQEQLENESFDWIPKIEILRHKYAVAMLIGCSVDENSYPEFSNFIEAFNNFINLLKRLENSLLEN